jgi:hypothetical protein
VVYRIVESLQAALHYGASVLVICSYRQQKIDCQEALSAEMQNHQRLMVKTVDQSQVNIRNRLSAN